MSDFLYSNILALKIEDKIIISNFMLHYILIIFKHVTPYPVEDFYQNVNCHLKYLKSKKQKNRRRARFVCCWAFIGYVHRVLCKLFITRGISGRRGDKRVQRGRMIPCFQRHTWNRNVTEIGNKALRFSSFFTLFLYILFFISHLVVTMTTGFLLYFQLSIFSINDGGVVLSYMSSSLIDGDEDSYVE